jgi:hypothetical protein
MRKQTNGDDEKQNGDGSVEKGSERQSEDSHGSH